MIIQPEMSHAAFEREFERFNRERYSFRPLEKVGREIETRFEDFDAEQARLRGEVPPLSAEEKRRLEEAEERWRVITAGTMSFKRDTNFFGSRIDPTPEEIYTLSPSIHASRGLRPWSYNTDFTLSYDKHVHFPNSDTMNYRWEQSLARGGSLWRWRAESLTETDSFLADPDESNKKKSNIRQRHLKTNLAYTPSPKFTAGVSYAYELMSFLSDSNDTSNTRRHIAESSLIYHLTSRTDIIGKFTYQAEKRPKLTSTDEIDTQIITLGTEGILTPKIAFHLNVDLRKQIFADPNTDPRNTIAVIGQLNYRYSPKTGFSLSYQRATVPTTTETSTDGLNHLVTLKATYQPTPKITLTVSEVVRYILEETVTSARDPDFPAILTTKQDEIIFLTTEVGLDFAVDPSTQLKLTYRFQKVDADLQLSNRTSHVTEASLTKRF